ncbi:MAG: tyrosine-type recombinase/integrase [Thermomicrobiales bacterium]
MLFHDPRHTNATLLGQGVHPKVVQKRLGHSQVAITLNIYSHVLPGLGREAIQHLDATLVAEEAAAAESATAEEEMEEDDASPE